MKAVIMAGGLGTRLRPLTDKMPKPMVPILGRPAMEYALLLLKAHGITDIAATLCYYPDLIKEYFGDGSRFGVNLRYFVETEPLGTAGSVKQAKDFLDDTFFVISGDGITDINLTEVANQHQASGAKASMALTTVEDPTQFGIVITDESDKIVRFIEKPKQDEVFSNTINTGIYVLEPEIFQYIPDGFYDFSKNLFPKLMEKNVPFYGFKSDGYWKDIGTLEQYRQVQIDLENGQLVDYYSGTQTTAS
ncbi:nucleotidyltransferase family protein [Heliophilum fasciatum]|uniref:Mannose-1-phosphate guanylyltransferase n=1 Tax=Heliophilum fasciatum TaxID=35700 RepID=A0A4R2RE10_9FIRM|nr:nucleotidyltransferase family protein [Heliophilum fasciatum]MCW2279298.1 NDP-sugar pyrophosphorylase family protein [Heliophilum fasciatum]TCP60459.1 mannose-1-phosphate guanylyltransferase [Heliophilum fasciatum]